MQTSGAICAHSSSFLIGSYKQPETKKALTTIPPPSSNVNYHKSFSYIRWRDADVRVQKIASKLHAQVFANQYGRVLNNDPINFDFKNKQKLLELYTLTWSEHDGGRQPLTAGPFCCFLFFFGDSWNARETAWRLSITHNEKYFFLKGTVNAAEFLCQKSKIPEASLQAILHSYTRTSFFFLYFSGRTLDRHRRFHRHIPNAIAYIANIVLGNRNLFNSLIWLDVKDTFKTMSVL